MSSADDILSPYFAAKPPVEKPMLSTISGLMIDRPSCCPLLTSNGLYISTPLIYTEFSSNEPPRTLYCDDSSLCVDTPACCWMSSSTALPDIDGTIFRSFVLSCSVWVVCRRRSVTVISCSASMGYITICTVILPFGRLNTRFLGP